MPSRQQVLDFIASSETPAGKREIAKAFGLHGQEKIQLKSLLKDMADEGLIDIGPARAFHKMGGVPKVTVLRIIAIEGNVPVAVPEKWEAEGMPPPKLRVIERGRKGALGIGDRILARTEEAGSGIVAHPMKKLAAGAEAMLGVLHREADGALVLRPVDKRIRHETRVSDAGDAKPGDLVLAEQTGRPPRISARVTDILGDPFQARSFSLIAIHKYGIPNIFATETEEEAAKVHNLPLETEAREDLRDLPIVAIDPVDARDFDDAVWASPDEDASNPGGYKAIVAIADVSFYVRPGSSLDREARRRGNSVYFPDLVVPMLPHALSSDMCSLRAGEDRAALACHLTIDASGAVTGWRFTRAVIRVAANIPYEQAQAAIDGQIDHPLTEGALRPLWACWQLLAKARAARQPLDLDLPERRVVIDEKGRITSIAIRERLDAHRLIEDYMIAANVAAAKALEAKKSPVMYRDHETPSREKLVALKDYLDTFEISFALGQVISPATFNTLIAKIEADDPRRPQIMEQILRSQTQAYYSPINSGHFGLALGSYAHFTSPIRRYSDLLVHRSLVGAYKLEMPAPQGKDGFGSIAPETALSPEDRHDMRPIGEKISDFERRAMAAERETVDRYVAAFLSEKVGQVLPCRITGVRNFGFFATVDELGGDGLVPVSTLGAERFWYDEASQALEGERSGERYAVGQRLELRLVEADPISGSLRFALPDGADFGGMQDRRDRHRPPREIKRRGRPGNIRHIGSKKGRHKG
ncbi:VacB/RNase II family 3'-5' exoribonuclease [Sphingobium sufflavum]|uniref:ribonuclease R family protein n=1 Tax=Sphingobium sufflavum TaxID=1129547 RepID=UPI001F199EAD|nr:VacB/RNase II family 3'-5' exoribonuclease [Sphingobium sufflavum]MCE7796595.1 VacB/RNase II family 3'-5' exoribonuclease [Sphingobium sufflavum]